MPHVGPAFTLSVLWTCPIFQSFKEGSRDYPRPPTLLLAWVCLHHDLPEQALLAERWVCLKSVGLAATLLGEKAAPVCLGWDGGLQEEVEGGLDNGCAPEGFVPGVG